MPKSACQPTRSTMSSLRTGLCRWVSGKGGRFFGDTAGSSLIEFTLVSSVFIMLLLAVVDFGRYFLLANSFQHAVNEGIRAASLDFSATEDDLADAIKNASLDKNVQVTAVFNNVNQDYTEMSVSLQYDFRSLVPFLSSNLIQIKQDMTATRLRNTNRTAGDWDYTR